MKRLQEKFCSRFFSQDATSSRTLTKSQLQQVNMLILIFATEHRNQKFASGLVFRYH